MSDQEFTRKRGLRTACHVFEDKLLYGFHPFALPLQKAAQKLLHGPRDVTFTFRSGILEGLKFSCKTSHRYFFLREDYEWEIEKHVRRFVKSGVVCYDVGAHYGFWALTMARLCGPDGRVFAFEPNPENRAILLTNVEQNGVKNIEVIPMSLSDSTGPVRMGGDGSTFSMHRSADAHIVECTTADRFSQDHSLPDFMLIDVEGAAGAVLRGAVQLLDRRRVPLICEIHNESEQAEFMSLLQPRYSEITKLDKQFALPNRTLAV